MAAFPLLASRGVQAQTSASDLLAATDISETTGVTDAQEPSEEFPPVDLSPYTYNDTFSVGLPIDWQVTEQENLPQVVATNIGANATPTAIRTEISWFDEPPETIVPAALQAIQSNGYTVSRYDSGMVDGTSTVRVWLIDLPDTLPNAYISYIGYDETTVTITSYYQEPLPAVDALLDQVHGSFQQISPQATPTE
jgi:hypothetical protein